MPQVETNGITTYYEEYGSGPPLVVLHGVFADHQSWAEILQPLADDYRVLLYDLRGHGRTSGSDLEQYTVDTYADDLAAFIDALGLDNPAILGHSFGGMIGYTFADRHPEKLSALITVGSSTPQSLTMGQWVHRNVVGRLVAPLAGSERAMKTYEWIISRLHDEDAVGEMDDIQRLHAAHDCEIPPPSAREHHDRTGRPQPSASERKKIVGALRGYYNSSPSWRFPVVPFLVMYGEDEPYVSEHAAFLQRELEHCQSMEIPDASHNSQVDNPTFIRSQIREFLSSA